jgi:hypothetical protein
LLALVPLPNAEIELTGGMSVVRSAWLAGHPPSIRIVGTDAVAGSVTIDRQPGASGDAGEWHAPDWDAIGLHTIRYGALSRTYEIVSSPQSWESWEAHTSYGLVVCGALVTGAAGRPIVATASGLVALIGRSPGEITHSWGVAGTSLVIADPGFEPIWAVPIDTGLHGRPLPHLIGPLAQPATIDRRIAKHAIRLWCRAVRGGVGDSRRWQDGDSDEAALWMEYRKIARALWRRYR